MDPTDDTARTRTDVVDMGREVVDCTEEHIDDGTDWIEAADQVIRDLLAEVERLRQCCPKCGMVGARGRNWCSCGWQDDNAEAEEQLVRLRGEVESLRAERDRWQEREASVCPEDFSFEEVIESLRAEVERERAKSWLREGIISQLDAYHARVAKLEEALRGVSCIHDLPGKPDCGNCQARAALEESDGE